jgi:hypothetical protein
MDDVKYDQWGRILYHPEYHTEHGKPYSEEDLEYLCKFCQVDGLKIMSWALGRPETSISNKLRELKKSGKFTYYQKLNKHWL